MEKRHRLVSVGDSMTQGFKSGSILETNISYPAIIAWEMGLDANDFRYPTFDAAPGDCSAWTVFIPRRWLMG